MKRSITFIFLLQISLNVYSQKGNQIDSTKGCICDEALRMHPELAKDMEDDGRLYKNIISNPLVESWKNASGGGPGLIPVVVHLVGTPSITDADVIKQIEILNYDYRAVLGTWGAGNGVDTEIEFCLASRDPDGNETSGIVRSNTNAADIKSLLFYAYQYEDFLDDHWQLMWADEKPTGIELLLGASSQWNPFHYLNIYVYAGDAGSMSSPPQSLFSSPKENNIYIVQNSFGIQQHTLGTQREILGRVLTHEVGHWLGLEHTFDITVSCKDNDGVDDTPICNGGWGGKQKAGCQSHKECDSVNIANGLSPWRQIENYMDYSDDKCVNMFTQGQKELMWKNLFNIRYDLLESKGCCLPGSEKTTSSDTLCDSDVVEVLPPPPTGDTTLGGNGSVSSGVACGPKHRYYGGTRTFKNSDRLFNSWYKVTICTIEFDGNITVEPSTDDSWWRFSAGALISVKPNFSAQPGSRVTLSVRKCYKWSPYVYQGGSTSDQPPPGKEQFDINDQGWAYCGLTPPSNNKANFDKPTQQEDPKIRSDLFSVYPNPFSSVVTIHYQLNHTTKVRIAIYNMMGQELQQLRSEYQTSGKYQLTFEGTDLARGIYYFILEHGTVKETRKLIKIL